MTSGDVESDTVELDVIKNPKPLYMDPEIVSLSQLEVTNPGFKYC